MLTPFLLDTARYHDERGYTLDLTSSILGVCGLKNFCPHQTLISSSTKWVIRGLHSQIKVPQKKLISVLDGAIMDVVVNIKIGSKDYGKLHYFQIDAKDNHSLYVPEGYLHGYQVLREHTTLCYQIDGRFEPLDAISVNPLDPALNIKWKNPSAVIMSKKDREGLLFENISGILS